LALEARVEGLRLRLQNLSVPALPGKGKAKKNEQGERLEHYKTVFGELIEIARREKKLPEIETRRRRMDSEDRLGDKRAVHVNVMLDDAGVEEAMYAIEQAAKRIVGRYFYWLCNFSLAAMGESIVGYGNTTLKTNHPDAQAFQTAFDSTGVYRRKEGMLAKAREVLSGYADERFTLVYLVGFTVMNFSFKPRA
jgi:hypothetical protein